MDFKTKATFSIEVAADTGDLCGESPLWVDEQQMLYWTDILGQRIFRVAGAGGLPTLVHTGFEVTGMLVHALSGFVIVNSRGLWHWDGGACFTPSVVTVDGHACQLNDCIADGKGRVLSGSQFFDPSAEYPRGNLFLFDLDGSARILDEGFELANGLAWSLDGNALYMTDSVARRIYAYDYDQVAGTLRNRRTLIQGTPEDGIPDGLTVDAEGYLWSAHWYGSCIVRYAPDGKEERRIHIPAKQISSVAFGGIDLADLYVTSAAKAELGPTPMGYDTTGYIGGALYRVRGEFKGRNENRAHLPSPQIGGQRGRR